MFPPTRCLPELRHLGLKTSNGLPQQLSTADLQAMVSCCPALGTLELGLQLRVAGAAPLQQLTALTTLSIHASLLDVVPSIAQLTGLQQLAVLSAGPVTASGLLQLTVLQQLQSICIIVVGTALDPGLAMSAAERAVVLFNKVKLSAGANWLAMSSEY